jgi:hypothetical protein
MLRPILYSRLKARLGEVKVAREGEALNAHVGLYQGRESLQVTHFGESYCVCCPFCGDTRGRLWVNHMWGYYDPQTNNKNLWLCWCYNNEECMRDGTNRRRLYDEVFSDVRSGRSNLADDVVLQGEVIDPHAMPGKAMPPGELLYLRELPDGHPARRYVRSRDFDPDVLSDELGVSFCELATERCRMASGRLIIPVVMGGEMKGWQSRLIFDSAYKGMPKYWNMPGMKTSMTLYNFDYAKTAKFVAVFEGPTKVWRFGRSAVALLGKSLSSWQTENLAAFAVSGKPILICMDANAQKSAIMLYDALRGVKNKVIITPHPDFPDPGDMPTPALRSWVAEKALEAGIRIEV